ncbi:MAG: LpqB family beta-propeller domain-containing protein, partial [Micrococcales bacterium]|nr:LpqB family beta-propeller domain-containing protein [Micrococcales bacterium]
MTRRPWFCAAVCLLVAGCAIPSSGPVHHADAQVDEVHGPVTVAQGPQPGAGPRAVVEGFLAAGAAGLTGDFDVARQFLAPGAARSWQPSAGALVTGAGTTLEQSGDGQVVATVTVLGEVDAGGRFTEGPATVRTVLFDLVSVDGQWRISAGPPGLVITERVFEQQYRRTPVYFLTPDRTALVPDLRYFPVHNLATSVVTALLDGPSPWLRPAVVSAVPTGVRLRSQAVLVSSEGVAQVVLEPASAVVSAPDRDLMLAQITRSLAVPHVRSVEVRAGHDGAVLAAEDQLATPVPGTGVVVVGDTLVVQGTGAPVDGVGSLARLGITAPATDDDLTFVVGLSGTDRLVTLPTATSGARTLFAGPGLARPSVDRHGWVWTATSLAGSGLHAVTADGRHVDLTAPWLADHTIHAVRVCGDGTRVAVASTGPAGLVVQVSGLVRDAGHVPAALTDP